MPIGRTALSNGRISVTTNNSSVAKGFFSIAEVADLFDVHPRSISRWIRNKELIANRFGRQIRISRADLEDFVRVRREG